MSIRDVAPPHPRRVAPRHQVFDRQRIPMYAFRRSPRLDILHKYSAPAAAKTVTILTTVRTTTSWACPRQAGCTAPPAGGAPLDGRTFAGTRRKDHAQQARRVSQRARPSTRPMTGVSLVLHPLPTSARSFRSSSKTPKSGNAASLSASPQLKSRSPTAATIILRAVASSSEDGG